MNVSNTLSHLQDDPISNIYYQRFIKQCQAAPEKEVHSFDFFNQLPKIDKNQIMNLYKLLKTGKETYKSAIELSGDRKSVV